MVSELLGVWLGYDVILGQYVDEYGLMNLHIELHAPYSTEEVNVADSRCSGLSSTLSFHAPPLKI